MLASKVSTRMASRPAARRGRVVANSQRTLWLPGVVSPAHLTGKLPGDAGFDPLGLGADAERLRWYQEAEKTNGRWAMAAVAGILFTEAAGIGGKWWLADRESRPDVPLEPLIAMQFIIMGFLETKRYQGWKETGTSGFINSFPFDPLNMGATKADMQTKEVKNGRLAMVAFIGFAMQALVSGTGPIEGLQKHLSNPTGYNITYTLTHLQDIKHY